MKIPRIMAIIASTWTVAFWLGCIAIPLFAVLAAIQDGEGWKNFTDPTLIFIVRATLWQAMWSTLISGGFGLVLGLVLGQWFSHSFDRPLYRRLQTLLTLPFGVPTVVVGMAWIIWLGRSGILAEAGIHLDWIYSLKAVILAHSFLNIPWVAYIVSQARRHLPHEQLEAARTLGARWYSELRYLVLPQVGWAFASACAQVLSLCAMSFALVLILGGGPPVQTLETELFGRLRYSTLDISGAAACAFWELMITTLPWAMMLFFQSRQKALNPLNNVNTVNTVNTKMPCSSLNQKWSGIRPLFFCWIALFFVIPYFATLNRHVVRIFTDLDWRRSMVEPLRLSFILAFSSSMAAVLTALMAMGALYLLRSKPFFKTGATLLLTMPSGVSVLVLSLGVWLAYGRWLDPFEGSLMAMIALQGTLFFPVAFRILWPIGQGMNLSQMEAAVSLGASSVKAFWWIEFSRWKGPLLSALAGVAGASLGEVGAVSLFYSEKLIPLPLLVSRWMEQYRFEEAQGIAGLLFLLSFLLMMGSLEMGHWKWAVRT